MSGLEKHDKQHLLLRLPDSLARRVRKLVKEGQDGDIKASDAVNVEPENGEKNENGFFTFIFEGQRYPAMLGNLPTIVETHKTYDRKIFLKSGDIGQVLYVFESEGDREVALSKVCKTVNGDYMPAGLTPPTADIVNSRFEKTRKSNETYPVHKVLNVVNEIRQPWITPEEVTTGRPGRRGGGGDKDETKEIMQFVSEEVVPFEDWMATQQQPTGVHFKVHNTKEIMTHGALLVQHPEILEFDADFEEESINEDLKRINAAVDERDSNMDIQATVLSSKGQENQPSAGSLRIALKSPRKAADDIAQVGTNPVENVGESRNESGSSGEDGSEDEEDDAEGDAWLDEVDVDEEADNDPQQQAAKAEKARSPRAAASPAASLPVGAVALRAADSDGGDSGDGRSEKSGDGDAWQDEVSEDDDEAYTAMKLDSSSAPPGGNHNPTAPAKDDGNEDDESDDAPADDDDDDGASGMQNEVNSEAHQSQQHGQDEIDPESDQCQDDNAWMDMDDDS